MALQHLRASTANKRPTPAAMADGQLAMNTNLASPGLFFKDSNGDLVKAGPVHVGTTAPNVSPASGGQTGNSTGEQWLDTSGSPVLKIWDGSSWRSQSGEFPLGAVGTPSITFTGDLDTGLWSPAADTIAASTNGSERARIDSSGRLLVGTSTARSNLSISPTPLVQVESTGTESSLSITRNSANNAPPRVGFAKSRSASVSGNTIVSNNDGLGEILFSGNDGTNFITGAAIAAQVDGTPGSNDMPGRLVFSTTADGASSPTERMRIIQNGNMHIGFTTESTGNHNGVLLGPNDQRIFSRTTTFTANQIRFANGNGTVGSIATSGSATAYNTSSDYRLKENVVPLIGAIDRLQQIPVHRFNFIADPDTTVDGFLAHEAQEIVPECVTGEKDAVDENGDPVYQGIDQSKLVPLLTAALQEALQKIEDLETRLDAANL
jgi:hypothetical protein